MSLQNPLARAHGSGSAKEGTHHWWMQRLSSVLLIPLVIWLIYSAVQLAGTDYNTAAAYIAQPVNSAVAILLAWTIFYHAKLGLQVVVEDYVHTPWLELSLHMLIKLFALLGALVATLAILRISFGG
jgi:succinate dehydrogenase / fumarate reductase membrane anchor subunit